MEYEVYRSMGVVVAEALGAQEQRLAASRRAGAIHARR